MQIGRVRITEIYHPNVETPKTSLAYNNCGDKKHFPFLKRQLICKERMLITLGISRGNACLRDDTGELAIYTIITYFVN